MTANQTVHRAHTKAPSDSRSSTAETRIIENGYSLVSWSILIESPQRNRRVFPGLEAARYSLSRHRHATSADKRSRVTFGLRTEWSPTASRRALVSSRYPALGRYPHKLRTIRKSSGISGIMHDWLTKKKKKNQLKGHLPHRVYIHLWVIFTYTFIYFRWNDRSRFVIDNRGEWKRARYGVGNNDIFTDYEENRVAETGEPPDTGDSTRWEVEKKENCVCVLDRREREREGESGGPF